MPFTYAEMMACAAHELLRRQLTYASMIDAGELAPSTAERELALMEQIAAHFRALDDASVAASNHPGEAATKPGPPITNASPLVRRSR
jgi:hypothetical protein